MMEKSDEKLSVEELTRQIAQLQAELQARQGQTAPTAQIEGGVTVGKGDAVFGTKIDTINIPVSGVAFPADRKLVVRVGGLPAVVRRNRTMRYTLAVNLLGAST